MLEGFDFGVGMLLPVLGRDEADRDAMFETIGPVWDGNEVWLIVAGGATFAAFPLWYATMFSGFYLALLLLLVLLILRMVSFEWRDRVDSPRGGRVDVGEHARLDRRAAALGNRVRQPAARRADQRSQDFAGSFGDLFSGYTVLAGVALVVLFAFHGAVFLGLRTTGDLASAPGRCAAASAWSRRSPARDSSSGRSSVANDRNEGASSPGSSASLGGGRGDRRGLLAARGRRGRAFIATASPSAAVVTLFVSLYPRVMVSCRRSPTA